MFEGNVLEHSMYINTKKSSKGTFYLGAMECSKGTFSDVLYNCYGMFERNVLERSISYEMFSNVLYNCYGMFKKERSQTFYVSAERCGMFERNVRERSI